MNDLLTIDAVEDRLRRTLRVRAEDMAPGDLTNEPEAAEPSALSASTVLPFPPVVPTPSSSGRSTVRRHTLVAAAALLLLGGAVASAVVTRGDGRDRVTNSPAATTGTTGEASDAQAEADARTGPEDGYPIGEYTGGGHRIHAQYDAGATPDDISPGGVREPVRAGDHEGHYVALPDGSISELYLVVDGGMVVLRGGALPRDQLIAAGATVTLDPATGLYTMPAPPGWTTVWTTPPDWSQPDPEAADNADAAPLGRLVDPAAPDARNVGVIWYRGWDESDMVPEGAEQVEAGGQTAYVGSIAPEFAEGLQLWIVYDDGLVELQAVGLSRDELISVAAGVHRTPGTEEFELTPPPGFEPEGG